MHEAARRHLVAELAEAGRRSAKAIDCPRCGRPVIRGEDHDDAAVVVKVDVEPIGRVEEMLAVFAGRATFDLLPMRGKGAGARALHVREWWHYFSERDHGGTVHALHDCERKR